jgi:hypothetical protein
MSNVFLKSSSQFSLCTPFSDVPHAKCYLKEEVIHHKNVGLAKGSPMATDSILPFRFSRRHAAMYPPVFSDPQHQQLADRKLERLEVAELLGMDKNREATHDE